MLTPQQVQETTFDKVMFRGYDMGAVDDFLEPLIEDYTTLYKENAILKSKLRTLVEKLEEYRARESSMNSAMVSMQKTCDEMLAEAERKCAKMLSDAESSAAAKSSTVDAVVAEETERLNRAKAATSDFIEAVEAEVRRQLDALANLKMMDLSAVPVSHSGQESGKPDEAEIADAIQQSVDKIVAQPTATTEPAPSLGDTRHMPPLKSEKFHNLQFGKNYTPDGK